MLKLKLSRDLRKNILRGHPWIYSQALEPNTYKGQGCMAQLLDKKGPLAWVLYNPESPLAARVLSTHSKPPNQAFFEKLMNSALEVRKPLISQATQAYRLINGEGDGMPGFICDVYGKVAVIQFDGLGCYEFWNQNFLAQWLLENAAVETVYFKPRFSDSIEPQTWGKELATPWVEAVENGVRFKVNVIEGQKTGFFLDQRENRLHLGQFAKGKSVLNLFSYTGGFSVYAGLGQAAKVTSVDIAPEAIAMANENWVLNGLSPDTHEGVVADVFQFVEQANAKYDLVMVDPPSMTHSEKTKAGAKKSYTDLFAQSASLVHAQGHLVLSSCSSHITFDDFFEIIEEALSMARRTGKIIRVSGQGMDHPFPHYCRELRYLKFVHLNLL